MATLSAEEIADFRADIGDTVNAFSDPEIQRLYQRAGEDYDKAILLALDQLIANAIKFADYTQNQSSERKSQIRDGLIKFRQMKAEEAAGKMQIKIVGMRATPPRKKDKPGDDDHAARFR